MDATGENSERWDRIFRARPWGRYPAEELVRFVGATFRDIADRSDLRVLELGCGPGANLWFLAREGFTVAGIDGSPTAIKLAGERLVSELGPQHGTRADLRVGNFASLPWPDANFDLVIDIEAIYANTSDVIRAAVKEIARVLKPGGHFFAKMFGPQTTGFDTADLIEPGTIRDAKIGPFAGSGIAHVFQEDELRALLAPVGALTLDHLDRTRSGGSVRVFEWIVQLRKPHAGA